MYYNKKYVYNYYVHANSDFLSLFSQTKDEYKITL